MMAWEGFAYVVGIPFTAYVLWVLYVVIREGWKTWREQDDGIPRP